MVTKVGVVKLAATVSPSWVVTEATTPEMGAWILAYPSCVRACCTSASASLIMISAIR